MRARAGVESAPARPHLCARLAPDTAMAKAAPSGADPADPTTAEPAPPPEPATPPDTAESTDTAEPADTAAAADGAPADEAPPPTDDPAALLTRLEEAQAEHAQMKDGLLRAKAEVENIRRRSQNEIVAARKFAIEGFAQELLSVKDSLERACEVELDDGAGEAVKQMKEGLSLTLKQLDLALAKFAVVEVEAAPGVRFDPERHQAVSATPSEEVEPDHIVSVVQKGFMLKERLLRPAMVVVAAAATTGD